MSKLKYFLPLVVVFSLAACGGNDSDDARASLIADPAGDFLPSFTGPRGADLDVRSGEVSFDGSTFTFESTSAGPIGTTPAGFFVWGVNRGAGTARFGAIAPGVLFDFVVIIRPAGTSAVRDLITNTATDLPAGSVAVSGNSLTVRVPASLLTSQGAQPAEYTVNLWPRTGADNATQIADFAPDNNNVRIRVVR